MGFAQKLKELVVQWAVGMNAVWIQANVHIANKSMLALNRKLGYKDTYLLQKKVLFSTAN